MKATPRSDQVLVAFPSTGIFGQQAALAFHEQGELSSYQTTFWYDDQSLLGALVHSLPRSMRMRIEPQLRRRAISALPKERIEGTAFWEVIRTAAQQLHASPPIVDQIWNHLSFNFTRTVAGRVRDSHKLIYAYEYTALEAFQAASRKGVFKVLDFPSLNGREFEKTLRQELARFPELVSRHDRYFEARFEQRQARRDAEMNLADIIITNSTVTRASHIVGGAPPDRTFAVPLGAPPTINMIKPRDLQNPLRVVWAGTFNIRKGAHYFIEAWRRLNAGNDALADVFGAVVVPDRLWRPAPEAMTFHGSVIREVLFEAFEKSDVLVFPTLSDGFGMVVTEAFSRGLPVITTDRAGASDLVQHGKNGLIVPAGDPVALAGALRWCLDHRAELARMRHAALATARGWQWSDYRCALRAVINGFVPPHRPTT